MEMLEQVIEVAVAASIRLGLPVVILFIIGYQLYSAHQRRNKLPTYCQNRAQRDGVDDGPDGDRPCWERHRCPAALRQNCPAYLEQQPPCWRAAKSPRGELQAECLQCGRFFAPAPAVR